MGRPGANPPMKDVILTCLLLNHTSFGRYKLSTYLGLTKAKTRSVLEFLTDQELAESSRGRGGTQLSKKGRKMMQEVSSFCQLDWERTIVEIDSGLIDEDKEIAVLLMSVPELSTRGLYERDTAVRQGADGAITIVNLGGEWVYPGPDQIKVDKISLNRDISLFNMLNIAFSDDIGNSYAGIAAILMYHLEDRILSIFQEYSSN